MRTVDESGTPTPQPSLADLDGVLEVARRAGWTAQLRVEGTPRAVSLGADLAAFRIAQEAVTNAVRH